MADSNPTKDAKTIDIYYKKTRNHRTIYATGAWAGVTPQGELQLAFFKDLSPMPDYVTHDINGAVLGPEISRVAQVGMVRETEATIVLSPETAENVIGLMQTFLNRLKELREQAASSNIEAPPSEGG